MVIVLYRPAKIFPHDCLGEDAYAGSPVFYPSFFWVALEDAGLAGQGSMQDCLYTII